jgi:hypothetical protein
MKIKVNFVDVSLFLFDLCTLTDLIDFRRRRPLNGTLRAASTSVLLLLIFNESVTSAVGLKRSRLNTITRSMEVLKLV